MNEGCGDDYSGTEVASEEIDVEGDLEPSDAHRKDGKEGHRGGDNKDNEDGRDASAEHSIIVIRRSVDIAEYLMLACNV